MMKAMPEPQKLHVNLHSEADAFWATVDELPGVFATGDDLNELRESLQEGIALILARSGEEPPAVTRSRAAKRQRAACVRELTKAIRASHG
jgi:predicted RNase H-like HicB family nuclease